MIVQFEVGKIYSFGRMINHTPYKFIKVIKRDDKYIYLKDIRGNESMRKPWFNQSYGNEALRNAEVISACAAEFCMPSTINALNEATVDEMKFVYDVFADGAYNDIGRERMKVFFDGYIEMN